MGILCRLIIPNPEECLREPLFHLLARVTKGCSAVQISFSADTKAMKLLTGGGGRGDETGGGVRV